jgi:hypothetical protein
MEFKHWLVFRCWNAILGESELRIRRRWLLW